jgi:hypothetical protein
MCEAGETSTVQYRGGTSAVPFYIEKYCTRKNGSGRVSKLSSDHLCGRNELNVVVVFFFFIIILRVSCIGVVN